MAIQPKPTSPDRLTQTQAEFSANASNVVEWMGDFADELNSVSSTYYLSVSTTSVTSNSIGTGSKSFTVQTGLGFVVGNAVRIANSGTNYMSGDVTSYDSGTGALVVNVTGTAGSGTYTSWTISLAAVGASAASDISNTPAGNISATTVQAAINELDTEKLSTVTSANMDDVVTGSIAGTSYSIPVLTINNKGRITNISSASKITTNTSIATTSGTSIDLSTSIPSGAKRLTVILSGCSLSGTSNILVQGGSGSFDTTGYTSSASLAGGGVASVGAVSTSGIVMQIGAAAFVINAVITFNLFSGNTWVVSGNYHLEGNASAYTGSIMGKRTFSGALDRLRLISANGTDTFDLGSACLVVE